MRAHIAGASLSVLAVDRALGNAAGHGLLLSPFVTRHDRTDRLQVQRCLTHGGEQSEGREETDGEEEEEAGHSVRDESPVRQSVLLDGPRRQALKGDVVQRGEGRVPAALLVQQLVGRLPLGVRGVEVSPGLHEQRHDLRRAVVARRVQRRIVFAVARIHVGAALQQQRRHRPGGEAAHGVAADGRGFLVHGHVERREAAAASRVQLEQAVHRVLLLVLLLGAALQPLQQEDEVQDDGDGFGELRRLGRIVPLRHCSLDLHHALPQHGHQIVKGHAGRQGAFGPVLKNKREELSEREETGGGHGAERVQVALLHV
ncbi:hypothetical protein EYF80_011652 [Liparis tanakae]|uniref:Uncharacterized protein n=1 Tax=Liparis tanakae TaxID=230148 RepID=A0A4Z2IK24_9TELE|nr:hypothetical protein EYF80_011652 [Liparis tanakae]